VRKELATRANDHELDTSPVVVEVQSQSWEGQRQTQTTSQPFETENDNYEIHTSPAVAEFPPKQTFSQPFDPMSLDSNVGSPKEPEPSNASSQTILCDTTTSTTVGASSSRMDELRAKRDRIRVEKERLLKLQELDEMEEAVQREMLEEQKRESAA
jgi:hypothetical protein